MRLKALAVVNSVFTPKSINHSITPPTLSSSASIFFFFCLHPPTSPSETVVVQVRRASNSPHLQPCDSVHAPFEQLFSTRSQQLPTSHRPCELHSTLQFPKISFLDDLCVPSILSTSPNYPASPKMALAMASAVSSAQDADLMDIDIDIDMDDHGPILDDEFQLEVRYPCL